MTDSKLQERAINAIRFLSADAIQQANFGTSRHANGCSRYGLCTLDSTLTVQS